MDSNNLNPKLYYLREYLREEGMFFLFKKLLSYLFRPFTNLINKNKFLIEVCYGTLPILKQKLFFFDTNPKIIKFPQSELVKRVRKFWYTNTPGDFNLDGEKISRKDIFIYGGPNPKFACHICQKSEWLSRIRQKNLFIPHDCSQAKECKELCKKQGDELWTYLHQNFDYSMGCEKNIPVAKCLLYSIKETRDRVFSPGCDILPLLNRRRLAYACQVDVATNPSFVNWSDYDFLFIDSPMAKPKFPRPNIPVILYGHDFWGPDKNVYQWSIDWLKPDMLLTAFPSCWSENLKIPKNTKIVFHPFFDSLFFSRPNLKNKKLDLLVIGATTSASIYNGRISLNKQLLQLPHRHKVEFSQLAGAGNEDRKGSVYKKDLRTGKAIHFLNKWSEYLGSSKYVIFGRMKYPVLVSKYYEILGSGAIPIFPEVPDLKLLGVKPFEHYIPLSEIEGNNDKLTYYLDNYDKYKYIAQNAVKWYKQNSDKMIFNGFEDMIQEITKNKYPRRIL